MRHIPPRGQCYDSRFPRDHGEQNLVTSDRDTDMGQHPRTGANLRKNGTRRVIIPRQSRGLYCVSRSKRLCGVANAAPSVLGHLDGGSSLPPASLI